MLSPEIRGFFQAHNIQRSGEAVAQHTVIGDNTVLNYLVSDKDVVFNDGKVMIGTDSYPVYVAKGSEV